MLSLVSPQYDVDLAEHHRDIRIANVRVDTSVGSFMRLALHADTRLASAVHGLRVSNVTLRAALRYLRVSRNRSRTGRRGDNFVSARSPSSIDVRIHHVVVNGKHVRDDAAWNMHAAGRTNVLYA